MKTFYNSEIKEAVCNFIDDNRQTGNTMIAIESALKHDAFYIVKDMQQVYKIRKEHPDLHHIYTINEIACGKIRGNKVLPIVFDPDVVRHLCSDYFIENYDKKELPTNSSVSITNQTPLTNQVNIKLSDEQLNSVKKLNNSLFEGEATLPTIIRLLIKKGLKYFQNINV
jgi:hypothetical protein